MNAYDIKELGSILKTHGLEIAEEASEVVVKSVLEWIEKSAVKSESKYDDLLLAVLPLIKPVVLKQVDKIDGKEG